MAKATRVTNRSSKNITIGKIKHMTPNGHAGFVIEEKVADLQITLSNAEARALGEWLIFCANDTTICGPR